MPKRVGEYPKAFRQMAVERMRHCASVSAFAQELGVDRTVLYRWRRLTPGEAGSADISPVRELRKEIRDLKRLLAEKALEADVFKGAGLCPPNNLLCTRFVFRHNGNAIGVKRSPFP